MDSREDLYCRLIAMGMSPRKALRSAGFTVQSWAGFYLDNYVRIEARVAQMRAHHAKEKAA